MEGMRQGKFIEVVNCILTDEPFKCLESRLSVSPPRTTNSIGRCQVLCLCILLSSSCLYKTCTTQALSIIPWVSWHCAQ